MTGLVIRFEALNSKGDVCEGYAHSADEARQKVKDWSANDTDFEVFFGSSAPQFLTLEQFRMCRSLGMPDRMILMLDQRMLTDFDHDHEFDFDSIKLAISAVLEYGLMQRVEQESMQG